MKNGICFVVFTLMNLFWVVGKARVRNMLRFSW